MIYGFLPNTIFLIGKMASPTSDSIQEIPKKFPKNEDEIPTFKWHHQFPSLVQLLGSTSQPVSGQGMSGVYPAYISCKNHRVLPCFTHVTGIPYLVRVDHRQFNFGGVTPARLRDLLEPSGLRQETQSSLRPHRAFGPGGFGE